MSIPTHRRLAQREIGRENPGLVIDDETPPPLVPAVNFSSDRFSRYQYQTFSTGTPTPAYSAFYPAHNGFSSYVYMTTTPTANVGTSQGGGTRGQITLAHHNHHHQFRSQQGSQTYTPAPRSQPIVNSSYHVANPRMVALRRGASNSSTLSTESASSTGAGAIQANWSRQSSDTAMNDNTRVQFRSKVVCELTCRHCNAVVCRRGMKAILLADMNIELFSTDVPPHGVQLVNDDYQTHACFCRIRDVACLGCGNVIGYHVTQPCEPCMEACNNGHFWMFHISEVSYADRMDAGGTRTLLWAHLPKPDKDMEFRDIYDTMCR